MCTLKKIDCINDSYGNQRNLDKVFGVMKEYVAGNLLYEVSHIIINRELYICIKEYAGSYILFASYRNINDGFKKYTCLQYLNQKQICLLKNLSQKILDLNWYEPEIKSYLILDGLWDNIIIYDIQKIGYSWCENPKHPYHILQEFCNTIYSFLPYQNGHSIGFDYEIDRYKDLVK